jgi:hypothetical protein
MLPAKRPSDALPPPPRLPKLPFEWFRPLF